MTAAAAAILGGIFYFIRFGAGFLDPGRVDWLLGMADTAFNQLGWMFFRNDAWHWPPGLMTTYMAPAGTTVGITDSLPLLAFPFKAVSFLLPATFQYAGLWLLINHLLMAVFAVKVAGLYLRPLAPRFLAAGILVLCPAWLIRDGHFALSAHWVLLAALYLYLKPAPGPGGGRPWLRWWLLLAAAALIHPYLATFAFLFLLADQARRWLVQHEISAARAVVMVGVGAGVLVGLWILAGYLRPGHLPVGNLREDALWSAGPNALWDGGGRALLLPALPLGGHDPFEGFVYLGAGGLLTLVAFFALGGRGLIPLLARHRPLAVVLLLCAAYAWGPRTGLGDQLFRAQARFLWPHFYVLVAAGLAVIARWDRPRGPLALLALVFLVQVVDLAPLLNRKQIYEAKKFQTRLRDPQWARAMVKADLLLTLPASTATTVYEDDFVDLALLAHEAGVPTTAGFATRNYLGNIVEAEDLARKFLFGGHPDPGTVGVLRRSHFAEMFPDFPADLRCTDLDGFPVCFAREGGFLPEREFQVAAAGLAPFLAANMDKTLILVGKNDARRALTFDAVQLLAGQGSKIGQLPVGASYVGILVRGKPVFEQMNPQSAIELTGARNSRLGPLPIRQELTITSSGTAPGGYASLRVAGKEVMFNRDGLNVAVLDSGQNVLAVGTFAHPHDLPDLAAATGGLVFTLERVR